MPDKAEIVKVLAPFYKTIDVMKSAHNTEAKTMCVWSDDVEAVEGVMLYLERLRDEK